MTDLITQFQHAMKTRNIEIIKQLILTNNNIIKQEFLLHRVVEKENHRKYKKFIQNIIELLINSGADINKQDINGDTPLHLAVCFEQSTSIIKFLILNNADVNIQNNIGEKPIHYAVSSYNYNINIIELLILNDSDINAHNIEGRIPLHYALETSSDTQIIIEMLIKYGSDINKQDIDGDTPLHIAVTELHLQCESKLTPSYEILIKHGADINKQNNNGDTPLHLAVKDLIDEEDTIDSTMIQKFKFLIKYAMANPNIKNNDNKTPLDIALIYLPNSYITNLFISHNKKLFQYACIALKSHNIADNALFLIGKNILNTLPDKEISDIIIQNYT